MKLKQLSKLCLAALVATTTFSLTSCNDDKETPAPLTDAQMLVGTWEITNYTVDGKPAEGEVTESLIGTTEEFTMDNEVIMCQRKRVAIGHYSLADKVISIGKDATTPASTKHTITKLDEKNLVCEFKAKASPEAPERAFVITLKKVPTNDMLQGLPFAGTWKTSKAFNTETGAEVPLSTIGMKSIDIKLISSGYVNVVLTNLEDKANMLSFACKLLPNSMPTPVIELYMDPERTKKFGELTIKEILDQGKKLNVTIGLLKNMTLELTR